ncbi:MULTISPECIES: MDR family oxidoreductase [unclassified Beijerinckia]|uniref:acrylyl-CoA reductase (NADPH) n=1 Tax=unclassified Beijerinckia TaxID=2638183 RepID=UPI00089D4F45|nr:MULTISPECIES: MDR family oxidoreductase [unclassified Beijerinckia]MDH7796596.1 acrylyl-CoA reductase (NADPH) [Beijerinckia sp. GAS462]SEC51841.1 acrylyl-CoA reductase (NADPH) [Beijerinckia sp. 28-YEA-48]
MTTFRAIRIDKTDTGTNASYVDFDDSALMDGDVTVRVSHSTVNYKDGLAITGASPVVRRFPMVPGIDFAGIVETSDSPAFKVGDAVVLTGFGVGEQHMGGFAQKARVKSNWLVPLPNGLTAAQAMAIGTAGFTAQLCLLALEKHGVKPADGPLIVTGAAGGVGSIAVALAKKAGWHVIASTGRAEEGDYLKKIGADEIIARKELSEPGRPLGKERWAAGIDSVGSHTLANMLAQTKYRGAIAACGLAQGMDLPASVAPFILRGVSLLGVDSVQCPMPQRLEAWQRLARDLDKTLLADMTRHVPFANAIDIAHDILAGKVRGRVVIDVEQK